MNDLLLDPSQAAEMRADLEKMLLAYVQYAPVDRLTLANVAGSATTLMTMLDNVAHRQQEPMIKVA